MPSTSDVQLAAMPAYRLPLDLTLSVNEVLLLHPVTVAVFNRFGVDACCGGAASLADAARSVGVEPVALLAALAAVVADDEALAAERAR